MIVTTEYGYVLHDTGEVVNVTFTNIKKFDVDVTLLANIYITVEAGPSGENLGYSYTAYFKKIYNDNFFFQVPITFEGVNQSANLDIGLCDDLHIAWQSNRDEYWDIYYINSVNELSPFRHETQITDTKSNSIRPSLSVSRAGERMVVWNDERKGYYSIYAARSVTGYDCNQKTCEKKMADAFSDRISECSISFDKLVETTGNYIFLLYFYEDSGTQTLYKTIKLEGNELRWFVDGVNVNNNLVYADDGDLLGVPLTADIDYTISYTPDKDDKIFDLVLYMKLKLILSEE